MVFKKKEPGVKPLSSMADAPPGVYGDAAGKFAEIYGSALVGQNRMFLISALMAVVTGVAVIGVVVLAKNRTIVPWIVEVDPNVGVVNKAVAIEKIKPSSAVIKAEMARFVTGVLTLDRVMSPKLMSEANRRATGSAVAQFAEFRASERVVERLAKEDGLLREVKVNSVDVTSNDGVAFVFATTSETRGPGAKPQKQNWRITIRYRQLLPSSEAAILDNPLGLYIETLSITKEAATPGGNSQ